MEEASEKISFTPDADRSGGPTCLEWSPSGDLIATMRKQQGKGAALFVIGERERESQSGDTFFFFEVLFF